MKQSVNAGLGTWASTVNSRKTFVYLNHVPMEDTVRQSTDRSDVSVHPVISVNVYTLIWLFQISRVLVVNSEPMNVPL